MGGIGEGNCDRDTMYERINLKKKSLLKTYMVTNIGTSEVFVRNKVCCIIRLPQTGGLPLDYLAFLVPNSQKQSFHRCYMWETG